MYKFIMGIVGVLVFALLIIAGLINPKSKIVTTLIVMFIWIIVGFNTYTPDYSTYENVYKQVSLGNGLGEFEPLFTFLMLVCGKVGLSFQTFRVVFGCLYAALALATAKKLNKSDNINTILAMFMLWPLVPNVSGIRFSLSSMLVCYFVPELINNKKRGTVFYILGVLIATLIHMSSAFYIILIIARKKMTMLKQFCIFALIAIAIVLLYSNIPLLLIEKFFDGVTARKLTMWLVTSSEAGFQHTSILGFAAFSLFVIAFAFLVNIMSKRIIWAYNYEIIVPSSDIKRITLYRNISYCLLLIIPGFVIAGIYERFLFGILPVYYSVFSEFRSKKLMIKHDRRIMYSFCFIMLVLAEIAFYIYSNTYVSNNFNLFDVFKHNLLISWNDVVK